MPTLGVGLGRREDALVKAGKLGHLVLSVRDCVRSRNFYTRYLGFKIASENLARGTVFLTLGNEHHVIALFQRASEEPPTPDQPGVAHIGLRVENLDALKAALQDIKQAGVPIEGESEDDVTRGFYVRDPDNYCIEVFCDRAGAGLQTIRASQLAARPLDIAAAR